MGFQVRATDINWGKIGGEEGMSIVNMVVVGSAVRKEVIGSQFDFIITLIHRRVASRVI